MITAAPREIISVLLFLGLLLVLYGLEVLLLARALLNRLRRRPGKSILLTRPTIVLHVLAVAGILCMLYGYFIEPNWVEVNRMTLHTPKLKSAGFRIVQISDLHCDTTPRNEEKAARLINALQPDIVVATGDYLNNPAGLLRLQGMLRRLHAPLGKIAVPGNFELGRWPHLNALEDTGFRLLRQAGTTMTKEGETLAIWGLDYSRPEAGRSLRPLVSAGRFTIFLCHTPDLVEDVSGPGVDLYLCGHTHGGQVRLPLYGALITFSKFGKKYESGLHQVGETTLYVNRGLGMEPHPGPQVRFLARPEIAVFDILPEQP
jgi:predicted MPP superfamily phosphohydrolase